NVDAEYAYEDAWYNYRTGKYNVDVHPLAQSKGRHYEAERAWFRQRLIYCMSMYGYGCFSPDGYNDTSLGRVTFRTQLAQPLTLTPAMDLYPTALSGQSAAHTSSKRVRQGESVTLSGVGGTNTNVYIMASDMLEDLGDLSSLSVDSSSNATLAIASKNLKTLKVGDETAGNVTSNVEKLDITSCPSLERVDARNLASLNGTVDLSQCPRLGEALFAGTNAKQITLPSGSKIETLQLPESLTVLDLQNLKFLVEAGLEIAGTANIQFVRIEGCPGLNPFSILRSIYNSEGQQLRDIRITGFTSDGDAADCTMLANLANDLDKDGADHPYNGIDSEGAPVESLLPVVQGTLNVAGNIFEDDYNSLLSQFPNLELIIGGGLYIRFADSAVGAICAANWGDGTGVTQEMADKVTTIGTAFKGNTSIVTFNELGTNFKNVTSLGDAFTNCTNLESVNLDNITTLTASENYDTFYGSGIKEVSMPNLEKMTGTNPAAFMNSKIERVLSLGRLEKFTSNSGNFGFFKNCSKLKFVNLPETLTTISYTTFAGTSNVETMNLPQSLTSVLSLPGGTWTDGMSLNLPNLTSIGDVFAGSHLVRVENLGSITKTGITSGNFEANGIFRNSKKLEFVRLPSTITQIGISAFYHCTALQTIIVEAITPPTFGSNALTDSNNCTIYVPDESVDAYKAASGWSIYSGRIKPLSEWPGDE
ncbi:MAG: leucine-rich repeat domain-containing protein, partial [Prevotella sp.]|nr:leucine-rich repeat domain-containing protein [Prevotella sp.]